MPILSERAQYLRDTISATDAFSLVRAEQDQTRQHEQILAAMDHVLIQSASDQAAASALWASGFSAFYPYAGQRAENYQYELEKYNSVINKDSISYLVETSDRTNYADRSRLRLALARYLDIALDTTASASQLKGDMFWSTGTNENYELNAAISYLQKFPGTSIWDKFVRFKAPLLHGKLPMEDLEEATAVFNTMEREVSRVNSEQYFTVVKLLHEVGFNNIDEYLEIALGAPPSETDHRMQDLIELFASLNNQAGEPELYFKRQKQSLDGIDLQSVRPDSIGLITDSFTDLGIEEGWQEEVFLQREVIQDITSAVYFLVPNRPQFAHQYEDLDQSIVWQFLQDHHIVTAVGGNFEWTDDFRLLFHEYGHALQAYLQILADRQGGVTPGASIKGQPITLSEIFSLFHESRMPQQEYFIARERFLTARFAGLTRHELRVWQEAEKVVKAGETDEAKRQFMSAVEDSYQQTLGTAVRAIVPQGRALDDFINPAVPMIPASYAYGMVGAAVLRERLATFSDPSDRYEFLDHITRTCTEHEHIDDVLNTMQSDWRSGIESTRKLFISEI